MIKITLLLTTNSFVAIRYVNKGSTLQEVLDVFGTKQSAGNVVIHANTFKGRTMLVNGAPVTDMSTKINFQTSLVPVRTCHLKLPDVGYSDWNVDDVENIADLIEHTTPLTYKDKVECVMNIVELLSSEVGMDYAEEVVAAFIEKKEYQEELPTEDKVTVHETSTVKWGVDGGTL